MTRRRRRWTVVAASSAAASVWSPATAGAHGIGGRTDLPLPVWQVAWGAGVAVVLSFAVLSLAWTTPRLARLATGRVLPRLAKPIRLLLRFLAAGMGVAALVVTIVAGLFGDPSAAANIAPLALYVVFWVGVTLVCGLFGDLWPAFNPIATLARFAGAGRRPPTPGTHRWPTAALGLLGFAWLELCYYNPASPRIVGWVVLAYTVVASGAVVLLGPTWANTGETFTAYFGLLGRLGPLTHGADGRWRIRPPLSGLATLEPSPALLWLVIVALGSTTFDGFSRLRWWADILGDRVGWNRTLVQTVGFLWIVALVGAAYLGACLLAARLGDTATNELGRNDIAERFAPSLVPIALAYAIAHYFSLLIFEGQNALIQASDPFGKGWNVFGTATWRVDYGLVSTRTIAMVQALAIVIGHVLGVVLAHDRAVERLPGDVALRSQYPLLGVMVGYTIGGLLLLFGA